MDIRPTIFLRTEPIEESKFVKRILKLNKVMRHCEKIKKLQPMFSLHVDEIVLLFEKKGISIQPTKSNEGTLSNRSYGHLSKLSIFDDFRQQDKRTITL